jgi:ribulose-5-phosphate 4-epimerase/fuculose-1-phosphate aldolase
MDAIQTKTTTGRSLSRTGHRQTIDTSLHSKRLRKKKRAQMIIHTTKTMQIAWKMHKGFRFTRSEDLDFMQGNLKVYGYHLRL